MKKLLLLIAFFIYPFFINGQYKSLGVGLNSNRYNYYSTNSEKEIDTVYIIDTVYVVEEIEKPQSKTTIRLNFGYSYGWDNPYSHWGWGYPYYSWNHYSWNYWHHRPYYRHYSSWNYYNPYYGNGHYKKSYQEKHIAKNDHRRTGRSSSISKEEYNRSIGKKNVKSYQGTDPLYSGVRNSRGDNSGVNRTRSNTYLNRSSVNKPSNGSTRSRSYSGNNLSEPQPRSRSFSNNTRSTVNSNYSRSSSSNRSSSSRGSISSGSNSRSSGNSRGSSGSSTRSRQ